MQLLVSVKPNESSACNQKTLVNILPAKSASALFLHSQVKCDLSQRAAAWPASLCDTNAWLRES